MEPQPTDTSISCDNCKTLNEPSLKFCPQCSFPMHGTMDEKREFLQHIGSRKRLLKTAHEKINNAKIIIYVIAGITALQALYMGFGLDDYTSLVVNLMLSILYLIMSAWSTKNPFAAILTAFIIYLTIHVINAFFDPTTLFSGIFLKIVFIAGFVKGISSAQQAQELLNELEELKAAPVGDR